MKVKVLKKFRDKDSLEIQEVGTVVEYNNERAEFLSNLGYVEEVKEEKKSIKKAPTKTDSKSRGAVK